MKLLEDLKLKFPLKEVAPYGFCIVVPGPEFDPDWEAELDDKGYKCFDTLFDQKPVTLVRLAKTDKAEDEKTVYSPPPAAPSTLLDSRSSPSSKWRPEEDEVLVKLWNDRVLIEKMTPSFPGRTEAAIRLRIQRLEKYGKIKKRSGRGRLPKSQSDNVTKSPGEQAGLQRMLKGKDTPLGPRWTEDDCKLLIKLWNERKKIREIAAKFPSRSGHAVGSALGRLKNSGAIKPRWTQKKNRFSKVGPESAEVSMEKSADTPVHTPSPAPAKDEVVELLKQILDALKPQEESVCFETYCPSCRGFNSVEDENVWKVCPLCGGPLIVWNVEAGKESS